MAAETQSIPAFSAFENQLKTLCLKEFPCGAGTWREPKPIKTKTNRHLTNSHKVESQFSVTLKDFGAQHEKTETLQEYVGSMTSPWHLDYSWSQEARKLREISVKSPWLIDDNFVLNHFKTLRIVNKNVTEIDPNLLKFQNLEELTLSCNHIENINSKNLPSNLKVLEICANSISDLTTLCIKPPKLIHLGLGFNKISLIGDFLTGQYWPHLLSLDLSNNNLNDLLDVVNKVGSLPKLRNLVLQGNPLSLIPGYRGCTVDSLRKLSILDDIMISADERHYFKGLSRRREHILDEAKIKLGVSYIKGIPMPEEIKNPEDQPEFPVIERKYFVQFMFLEDASTKQDPDQIDHEGEELDELQELALPSDRSDTQELGIENPKDQPEFPVIERKYFVQFMFLEDASTKQDPDQIDHEGEELDELQELALPSDRSDTQELGIKNPEDQPEFPVIERKYFVQFMFLEDASTKQDPDQIDHEGEELDELQELALPSDRSDTEELGIENPEDQPEFPVIERKYFVQFMFLEDASTKQDPDQIDHEGEELDELQELALPSDRSDTQELGIENPEDQPEFPVIERKYFVQFMFLEDASTKQDPDQIEHEGEELDELQELALPSDRSDTQELGIEDGDYGDQSMIEKNVNFTQEPDVMHTIEKAEAQEVEKPATPEVTEKKTEEQESTEKTIKVFPVISEKHAWGEDIEVNWNQMIVRDDLVSLRDFLRLGMEISVVEEMVLCYPVIPEEPEEGFPNPKSRRGSSRGKQSSTASRASRVKVEGYPVDGTMTSMAKSAGKNKKQNKDTKSGGKEKGGDKKKKKEPEQELKRNPPTYQTLATWHVPLAEFLEGEFDFQSVYTQGNIEIANTIKSVDTDSVRKSARSRSSGRQSVKASSRGSRRSSKEGTNSRRPSRSSRSGLTDGDQLKRQKSIKDGKKDPKDKKKPPSAGKKKEDPKDKNKERKASASKAGKDGKVDKSAKGGKGAPVAAEDEEDQGPPPLLEIHITVNLHHWKTAMDLLRDEEEKNKQEDPQVQVIV